MAIQNIDDMLIEQNIGRKLDPLPEKPAEPVENVARETFADITSEPIVPEVTPDKKKIEKNSDNEYGEKSSNAEPSIENEQIDGKPSSDSDEYGLEVETSKSYSKAEMDAYANQIVRERLSRLERNSGITQTQKQIQQQVQQTQQEFNYDENSNLDWQQQLKQFVKQTNIEQQHEYHRQVQQAVEQQRNVEFESKFRQGMNRFGDYHDVVGGQNITDAMVMGARGINDPASFFYAAAKRAPEELAKIANNPDPYAQAAAIGRLDERLRKQANKISNAPRPLSQTRADMEIEEKQKPREKTIDDMLHESQAKKREIFNAKRG